MTVFEKTATLRSWMEERAMKDQKWVKMFASIKWRGHGIHKTTTTLILSTTNRGLTRIHTPRNAFAQSEDKDQCTPNQDDNNLDPITSLGNAFAKADEYKFTPLKSPHSRHDAKSNLPPNLVNTTSPHTKTV
jgi:hypothetical protein